MARTRIRSKDILDGGVKREDINTTISGRAVITKLIAGHGIGLTSTGVDSGTGDVTVTLSQGTTNTIPQFGAHLGLVDSIITQVSGKIGINHSGTPQEMLTISQPAASGMLGIRFNLTGPGSWNWTLQGDGGKFKLLSYGTPVITTNWSREVGLNVTGYAGANLHIRDFTTSSTTANTPIIRLETRYHSGGSLRQITWHDGTNITGSIATNFDGTFTNLVFGHLYNGGYKTDNLMTLFGNGNLTLSVNSKFAIGNDVSGEPRSIKLRSGYSGDQSDAGTIAYRPAWSDESLSIIGAGTSAGSRIVHIWDIIRNDNIGGTPAQDGLDYTTISRAYGDINDGYVLSNPEGWLEVNIGGNLKLIPYYTPE